MPLIAQSGAPDIIPFQGVLTDGAGDLLPDGTYALTFSLYTAASGGTPVWTQLNTGVDEVPVTDGRFDVLLTGLGSIPFDQQLYLGIKVESDPEITPRIRLGSVPYALAMRDVYSEGNDVIVSTNLGIAQAPTRELTVGDTDGSGDAVLNLTATGRELLVGVNQSTGALIRMLTNNNLNLGAGGSDHLTVRSDGDIHVHENLLVGTTAYKGKVTVRGPDDAVAGPIMYMFGNGSDQVESGRIRFAEATTSWRGAFIHYDGSANKLHIGTHNTSDQTPGNDLNAVTINRSSRNVTIHEDLLAGGDIRKDYGDGAFTPATVFAMGVLDASPLGFDFQTANVVSVVSTISSSGNYTVYFDEGCPTSNVRLPYVASITMLDPGVDDVSAEAICRSSGFCDVRAQCVALEIRPYNVFGFVNTIDLQFVLYKVE